MEIKGSGNPITENAILNATNTATIKIDIENSRSPSVSNNSEIGDRFQWTLAKTRAGRKTQHTSQLNDCTR